MMKHLPSHHHKPRLHFTFALAALLLSPTLAPSQSASSADQEIKVLGYLEPIRNIQLTTSEAGRISDIFLKQGDPVSTNDPILKLETSAHEAGLEIAQLQAESTANIDAATAETELAQNKYDVILSVERRGAAGKSEVLRAKANLQIAKANLQSAEEEKAMAAHQVTKIQAEIERRFIRSPINGIVVDIRKDINEFLSPSEEFVAHVAQLDKLRLVVHIPEKYTRALSVNMALPVRVTGEVTDTVGTIEFLSPVIDPSSGTVRARLIVDNPNLKIRSGSQAFVTVARIPAP